MATWRAEVFVNSQVGRITTEVEAATASGAQQQIYAKHGNVQQIVNLRQVSSGSRPTFNSDNSEGFMWLFGIGFVLYLVVNYWYIAIPVGIILLILIGIGMSED